LSLAGPSIVGGASATHSRNPADFYPTPRECTIALLERYGSLFEGRKVWEPACGDGAISKVLQDEGYYVASSDLHDRGFGNSGEDFLTTRKPCEAIVTNPPFNVADKFIEHASSFGVPFAMLLKSQYWHAAKRIGLFNRYQPLSVMAMAWRPSMCPERGKAGTMDFCWTVWMDKPSVLTSYWVQERPVT
jgi:hypothetical protein